MVMQCFMKHLLRKSNQEIPVYLLDKVNVAHHPAAGGDDSDKDGLLH